METLAELAASVAARLKERRQTIAVSESSTGGLISASLLAVPGASAYFLGGAVVYTRRARVALLGLTDEAMDGMRSDQRAVCRSMRGDGAGTTVARPGASPRPARPDRPATATATPPAIPASRIGGPQRVFTMRPAARPRANMRAFAKRALEELAAALQS